MENINSILLVVQVLLSISLIVLILMQFGSGASATVFGARGSGNFLSRATTIIAILFFVVCLSLAYISSNRVAPDSVSGSVTTQQLDDVPAADTGVMQGGDLPPAETAGDAANESDLPPAE